MKRFSNDYFFGNNDVATTRFVKLDILENYNLQDTNLLQEFAYRLLCYCTIAMDMYMLARLFRTYNIKDQRIYSGRARNVITLTGSEHSMNYSNFLGQNTYFVKKFEDIDIFTETIDNKLHTNARIRNLEQPVFLDRNRIL
jgi:hypothetical protein